MSRDSKAKPQNKSRGGTLIGMFIGLVLGVCIAAGVVWYTNRVPSPFSVKPQPPRAEANPATPGKPGAPLPLPGKPGDPVPEKRFQFYDILPGKGEASTEAKPEEKKKDAKKDEAAKKDDPRKDEPKKDEVKSPPTFLQAGSFSSAQDADNQKAKLALLGVEATVLQVMVQDKTHYRVRLGPFAKVDEANKVRAELAKSGVEVSPIKKEP